MKNKNWTELFGATSNLQRTEEIGVVGDYTGFSDNRFTKYGELYTISPHTFISIQKLGLAITKDYRFEGKKNLVKNFETWATDIDLDSKLQEMVRLAYIHGIYVALYLDKKTGKEKDINDIDFVPLLMSNISLLPDNVKLNKPTDENEIMLPPVTRIVVDEKYPNKTKIYRRDNCFIFAPSARDIVQKDIIGRETYGVYGISLFKSIEDTIFKYIDLVTGYCNYIHKYGVGRYFIDYSLIADLVKTGEMDLESALEVMQQLADTNSEIKQNEDIVGIGFDLKQLDSGGSNINVEGMKKSLENDIHAGLFQSSTAMGDIDSGSYASAYMSENSRIASLEGFQKALAASLNGKNGIIGKRLEILGKKSDEVKIVFNELSIPNVTANDFYQGMLVDAISVGEYRVRALNLPELKPDDVNKPIVQNESTPQVEKRVKEKNSDDIYPEYPSDAE